MTTGLARERLCCSHCHAIYRSGFHRCPSDGAELVPLTDDPIVGMTIAERYVVEACVGEGAMGRVYRARHVRLSQRLVAIKILLGELAADAQMRIRFAQEAEAASRLSHANVVPVLDFGRTPEGLLYLVMDFVDGQALSEIMAREGALPQDRVVALARQLCEGLAHAHDRGFVHRDFKPGNVMVVRDGEREIPRILDFGLAIAVDSREDAIRLTTAGTVVGTPVYISPEQAREQAIDHRADLFSLGVTLYEMLAGRLPFDGSVLDVLRQNATQDAPPIAERSPGVRVGPEMDALVRRLMARKPEDRPADARAVIAALDAIPARGTRPGLPALAAGKSEAREAFAETAAFGTPLPVAEAEAGGRGGKGWLVAGMLVGVLAVGVGWWVWGRGAGEGERAGAGHEAGEEVAEPVEVAAAAPAPVEARPAVESGAETATATATETTATETETATATETGAATATGTDRPKARKKVRKHEPVAAPEPAPEPSPREAGGGQGGGPTAQPPAVPEPSREAGGGQGGGPTAKPPVVVAPKPQPPAVKKPLGLDARVQTSAITVTGPLPRSAVDRAVDRVAPAFGDCYRQAARRAGGGAAGTAQVRFTIDESKAARGVAVTGAPLGISGCIAGALSRLRTREAPDVGTAKVSFTIRFTPLDR